MEKLRKINKVVAFILALSLVFGMTTMAFASQEGSPEPPAPGTVDMESIIINKDFTITNGETVSPAETFGFTITKMGVTDSQYILEDMPMFNPTTFNIAYTEGEATTTGDRNSFTLNLPNYNNVGIFTYKLEETVRDTAGVTYDGRDLFLKVYVVNNPAYGEEGASQFIRYATLYEVVIEDNEEVIVKVEGFENEFAAGNLAIEKSVTGNLGDENLYFDITVKLTKPEGKDISKVSVVYSGGKYTTDADVVFNSEGVATLELEIKHGDTITIENLPYGVTWEVEEADYSGAGYTTTFGEATTNEEDGTIGGAIDTVTIINDKEADVDTGIILDNLPYIMIILVVTGGLLGYTVRKRKINE